MKPSDIEKLKGRWVRYWAGESRSQCEYGKLQDMNQFGVLFLDEDDWLYFYPWSKFWMLDWNEDVENEILRDRQENTARIKD